jgi:hypothetical protein
MYIYNTYTLTLVPRLPNLFNIEKLGIGPRNESADIHTLG